MCLLISCAKRITSSLWSSSRSPCYLSNYEKISDRPKLKDDLQDTWPSTLPKLSRSVMKNKERLRELWRPVETKDTWQLKACEMQDLIQDQKKDIHEKTESQGKSIALVTTTCSFDNCILFLQGVNFGGNWMRCVVVCSLCSCSLSLKLFQNTNLKIHT